jgi:WD40 repeat protein
LTKHEAAVLTVAFSPDGKLVASAAVDGSIHLVEAENGREVIRMESVNGGAIFDLVFTPDGKHLIAADRVGVIEYFAVASGKSVRSRWAHRGEMSAFSVDPGGELIASGGLEKDVKVWKY